ncbi:hypothetical protein B0H34DRAFT_785562 [Crassisporium funariophilum]|nr:hypothetical protein B0H34DRAFT_785562 [Crassisporium funariophilum]
MIHPPGPRRRSASHVYSFDVLRSDPTSASLQHLTSSATFPNRAANPQQLGPNTVVGSGSSPAFRVSVAPTMRNGRPIQYTMITPPSESGIPAGQSYRGHTAADPAIISFPISRNASGSSKADQLPNDANLSDDESPAESTGKKHVCPTCMKRFNRPSSLRIHVNTHTGATPFRCPWPNCGREFNVNSNMRRHYRNHTTPGFSRAQPNDNRRKRRRLSAPQPLSYPMIPVDQSSHRRPHHPGVIMPSPPISHFSMSDDSDDESDMDGDSYTTGERDDSMQYNPRRRASPDYRAASGLAQSMARVAVAPAKYQHHGSHPYASSSRHSYPHDYTRPLTPVSSLHSSSPSPSHSPSPRPEAAHSNLYPPRKEYKYTASAPYVLSLADSRVSTALRPAFHSQSERSSSRPW